MSGYPFVALRRAVHRIEQGWSPECDARPAEGDEWGVLKAGCLNTGSFDAAENKALPPALTPPKELAVKHGDLLMSRASGSRDLIGSIALVLDPPPRLLLSDKLFRLVLVREYAEPHFLRWALTSTHARSQIEAAISGSPGLANNLPQSELLAINVPLPSRSIQRAIADFLDHKTAAIDALIAKKERLLELLAEKRQALPTSLILGACRLDMAASPTDCVDARPSSWRAFPLWALFRPVKEQGFPALPLPSVYRDLGVVLREGRDDNHNRPSEDLAVYQRVEAGDVVVNKMKAWQGSVAVSRFQGIVSPDYEVLRPRTALLDTDFLHGLLRSGPYIGEYRRLAYGIRPDQWRLMFSDLRNLPILVPPKPEQRRISQELVVRLDAVNAAAKVIAGQVVKIREYRQALITAAVTGQLDVTTSAKDAA